MRRREIFHPRANPPERFRAKWTPVRVKKTRQIKSLELRFDSIETEKALEFGYRLGEPVVTGQPFVLFLLETAIRHAFRGRRLGIWLGREDGIVAIQPAFRSIVDFKTGLQLLGNRQVFRIRFRSRGGALAAGAALCATAAPEYRTRTTASIVLITLLSFNSDFRLPM